MAELKGTDFTYLFLLPFTEMLIVYTQWQELLFYFSSFLIEKMKDVEMDVVSNDMGIRLNTLVRLIRKTNSINLNIIYMKKQNVFNPCFIT